VTTGQIYWGAVPFVCIQVVMVCLVIAFPGMVLHALDRSTVDPSTIEINVPEADTAPPLDFDTPESEKPK
jgi:hypothetical protein